MIKSTMLRFFAVAFLVVNIFWHHAWGEKVNNSDETILNFVITESAGPNSLDPLDADNVNNHPVARMIYATPLEISDENQLVSSVLSKFDYDINTKTVTWEVRKDVTYDNGKIIPASDVAFAVARMAYSRPRFPVVEKIDGLSEWIKEKNPLLTLPRGIKVLDNKITIKFSSALPHPLFRFCLELFSIIPKDCVDLEKNTLSCKTPPTSGYYRIIEKTEKEILFQKRSELKINGRLVPKKMRFKYVPPDALTESSGLLDGKTIFSGKESMFSENVLQSLEKKYSTKFSPASYFSVLLLNPNVAPFTSKACRLYFANKFRETYKELSGKSQVLESSVFTKILPGYLSSQELSSGQEISQRELKDCEDKLKTNKISWGYAKGEKKTLFLDAVKATIRKLTTKNVDPVVVDTRKDIDESFVSGKIALFGGSTGFWALDPAGDMKMLLTPNLHKALKFVSVDEKVQMLISELNSAESFKALNRYLYENALFNVYTHQRHFYASSNSKLLSDVPIAITSPAPWQVFRVK